MRDDEDRQANLELKMVVDLCRYIRLQTLSSFQSIKEKHEGQQLGAGEFRAVSFSTQHYFSHFLIFALAEMGPDNFNFICACLLTGVPVKNLFMIQRQNMITILKHLGPLHMSPVNRTDSVSDISPRHSFLCKNIDVFI